MSTQADILLIEDERDLADLVKVNLELSGYEVRVAHDGAAGLEAAREDVPDLVLLDVMMPVLDGWSVLRVIREDEDLQDVPVIMLTALTEEREVIRGHLDGALDYITKPFEMQRLLDAVDRGLREQDDEHRRERRERVRGFLQRLAELDSGRTAERTVRLSRLEQPTAARSEDPAPSEADRRRLKGLTENQRHIVEELADGKPVRELAEELGVSRSNIYATRKRIARKLGVPPEEVTDEFERLRGA